METILHLLSSNYLLNKNLGQYQSDLAYFFVGLSVLPVVIAVILRMTTKNSDIFAKKAVVKFSSFAWTMGVIGLILYSFRQINVFYLSAPIFVLIWLVIAIIWLISVLNFWLRVAPKRRKEINQNAEKKYYMP